MKPTEKSKLLKRLKGFCSMLGNDLSSLDRDLVERLESIISRLQKPAKVVIAGVSGSDHRRLAEFLVGADLFSADDATNYPAIQIRNGAKPKTHAIVKQTRSTFDGVQISDLPACKTAQAIGIELPKTIIGQIEVAILPDYDDEEDRVRYLVDLIENTEAIIWCSEASTTWQPSERRVWFTIPDELKSRSILALTGADRISGPEAHSANKAKRDMVVDEFCSISPVAIDAAKGATHDGAIIDPTRFTESGGQEILSRVLELIEDQEAALIQEARTLRADIDTIPLGDVGVMPPMPTVETPKETDLSPSDSVQRMLVRGLSKCQTALTDSDTNDQTAVFEAMNSLLTELLKGAHGALTDDPQLDLIGAQISEASELIGLLSYENDERAAGEAADILRQMITEVWQRVQAADADNIRNLTLYPQLSEAG